jgi:NAD(P)-dependent dehydrogenase (short-subunit alcohol dehydrogenase family)
MKTAIITGASGNLGQAVVKKFINEGYKVIGTVTSTDMTRYELPPAQFEKIAIDLLSEEDCQKTIEAVVSKNGSIDVAVLTVGGFAMGHMADTTTSDLLQQYKLNFETAYNIARPIFLQMLKQNGGHLFLVGSRPGLDARNSKGMVAYGLAKSLLFRLAELMNEEGKANNVVTSVIVPGTIDTPQNRKAMPGADFNQWVKAETIANIICYYCSEDARSVREPVIKLYGNS